MSLFYVRNHTALRILEAKVETKKKEAIMSKEVKSYEEAQQVLKTLSVTWVTTNKNKNRIGVTGVAFFNSNHLCIAYYDEIHNMLSII